MKISDLKFGDITTRRNGSVVVINDNEKLKQKFNDNLTHKTNKKYDIMKVQRYTPSIVYERFYYLDTIYERKEGILDDVEKEYLRGVIEPFKDIINSIAKYKYDDKEFITVYYTPANSFSLPPFKKGTMYKSMEVNRCYTIKKLGL